ncbi:MAG: hypothetical protein KKD39_09025 [Candidatus Altiarchaeota archaeon]|nr:hypothetical protein [Candidatus Altiarchaeota archaeon]
MGKKARFLLAGLILGWGLRRLDESVALPPKSAKELDVDFERKIEEKITERKKRKTNEASDEYVPSYELALFTQANRCMKCGVEVRNNKNYCPNCLTKDESSDLEINLQRFDKVISAPSLYDIVEKTSNQRRIDSFDADMPSKCPNCSSRYVFFGKTRRCPKCDTYCSECGYLVDEKALFCPRCHTEFEKDDKPALESVCVSCGGKKTNYKGKYHCELCDSYCENCGAIVAENANYCINCMQEFE